MVAIVEVTATEPTRAVLKKPGPLKHVRFVSKPSGGEAVRRVVVARLSDLEERPEELLNFATRGSSAACPFVLLAFGARSPSVSALQLLALLTSRSGTWKVDSIREFIDPEARRAAASKYRVDASQYGSAIRMVREAHDLRQGKILGLSEREVRRLEHGEVLPHSETLRKLAAAHGMSMPDYMAKLAGQSTGQPKRRRRGTRD